MSFISAMVYVCQMVILIETFADDVISFPVSFEDHEWGSCPSGWTCKGNMTHVCHVGQLTHGCINPGVANTNGTKYFIVGDDMGVGEATSSDFRLPNGAERLSFRRCGGANVGSGFFVKRSRDGKTLCAAQSGNNTNVFFNDTCSGLSDYGGNIVHIQLVDSQRTRWGKVMIDDIRIQDASGADCLFGTAHDMTKEQECGAAILSGGMLIEDITKDGQNVSKNVPYGNHSEQDGTKETQVFVVGTKVVARDMRLEEVHVPLGSIGTVEKKYRDGSVEVAWARGYNKTHSPTAWLATSPGRMSMPASAPRSSLASSLANAYDSWASGHVTSENATHQMQTTKPSASQPSSTINTNGTTDQANGHSVNDQTVTTQSPTISRQGVNGQNDDQAVQIVSDQVLAVNRTGATAQAGSDQVLAVNRTGATAQAGSDQVSTVNRTGATAQAGSDQASGDIDNGQNGQIVSGQASTSNQPGVIDQASSDQGNDQTAHGQAVNNQATAAPKTAQQSPSVRYATAWQCVEYGVGKWSGIDQGTCEKEGTIDGTEYKFSKGDGSCGTCWCCARAVPTHTASSHGPAGTAFGVLHSSGVGPIIQAEPWQCVHYGIGKGVGIDPFICSQEKALNGQEYKFSRGDGTCDKCWCCTRAVSAQLVSGFAVHVGSPQLRASTRSSTLQQYICLVGILGAGLAMLVLQMVRRRRAKLPDFSFGHTRWSQIPIAECEFDNGIEHKVEKT